MGYELVDASGDVALRATEKTIGAVLVELGRGLAHVLTEGSPIAPSQSRRFQLETETRDLAALAVAFVQELVFLFETEGFLVAAGTLDARSGKVGHVVKGTIQGEPFDPRRHQHGTAVKAATFHDAFLGPTQGGIQAYLMLDL